MCHQFNNIEIVISLSSYNGYKLNSLLTCFNEASQLSIFSIGTGIAQVIGSNPVEASDFFSDFFSGLSLQLLKLHHNCEDHLHFYSLAAVHIYDLYIYDMHIILEIV